MVAGRRLRLLEELKLGGQNYYQLAGLFNVSTRTVQRDVRALLGMNWEKCSRCGGLRRTRP
jgi:predicted DNA-binding transcriptional regulator YafY